ncbi:hypothetical protein QBC46DRAFT_374858 [Diplogelasinospora grovesii]|uniref:Uncharacterized protein n=1 Tax=Diplogelasinospora grovesii TaxID=303347 RepID=A0AAN6S8D6_9PEZI|nr:hypothetical protein QBC46DRAFT_374858 [Diplogelasinospora grovesii]
MLNWEVPDDREKPPCPYVVGFKFGVTAHDPPPPFGGASYRDTPGPRPWENYRQILNFTQTQYCIRDLRPDEPSRPATPVNGANGANGAKKPTATAKSSVNSSSRGNSPARTTPVSAPSRSLVIDFLIRSGDQAGAQVVTCHWDNDACKTKYVAKIYDPLYYSFEDVEHPGVPTDVVWNAARDYSIEAAAYQQLQAYETAWRAATPRDESKNIRGCYPAFFGCFSTTFKLVCGGQTYTRTVPLILTEHFQSSMASQIVVNTRNDPNGRGNIRVVDLPGTEDSRIHAFSRAASSYMRLTMAGVGQGDFAPRNIFLVGRPDSANFRAVIGDFNVAKIFSRMTPKRKPPATMDPISFCEDPSWEDRFHEWLPQWFFTDKEKRRVCLRKEFPTLKP